FLLTTARRVGTVAASVGDPLSEPLVRPDVRARSDSASPREGLPDPELSGSCMDSSYELFAREVRLWERRGRPVA
ncbi:MAG TPA: hypothetical protein VMV09_00740, partial [Candidatus Saccharimonadales bacterium]|nr:hypothetical protein [Candidatus Saccharimonadales bacterium]